MGELLVIDDDHIQKLVGMSEAIDAVERVFAGSQAGSQMPPKLYLGFPIHDGDIRVMPAAIGEHYAGVKVVNSHSRNPAIGLPTVIGTYLLLDQRNGVPLAIMNATALTAIRTGAASAVATKHLARQSARSLGLIGAGVQAVHQADAIARVRDVDDVLVWSPADDEPRRSQLVAKLNERFERVRACELEQAASADIVVTTTPSRAPLVLDHMIAEGTHINAVGADGPGKQELDPKLLKRSRVIVDELEQAMHGGEVNVPLTDGAMQPGDIAGSLAQVVSGEVEGRNSQDQITVFDSTGLAIEDVAVAVLAYERAVERGGLPTIKI